eukprot:3522822-Prymnesium_polylepis.1
MDWDDIPPVDLVEPIAQWPPQAARSVKELAFASRGTCLCASSKRRRASLADARDILYSLLRLPDPPPPPGAGTPEPPEAAVPGAPPRASLARRRVWAATPEPQQGAVGV